MAVKGEGKTIQWLRDHVNYAGDECLIWPFFRNPNGYGQLGHLGKGHYAHRLMCELAHGKPPTPEHESAHSCGNGHGGCANPKHLSWKTISENLLDCREHGTHVRSYHGIRGRLTDDQVNQIRSLRGEKTQAVIACMFGISEPTVRDIFLGRSHAKPRKLKLYTPNEDAKIGQAIRLGYSLEQMAELVGRSVGSVSGRAQRLKIRDSAAS